MVYKDDEGNYRNAAGWKVSKPDDEPSQAEQDRSRDIAADQNDGNAPGTSSGSSGGGSSSGRGPRTSGGEPSIPRSGGTSGGGAPPSESTSSGGSSSGGSSEPDIFDPTSEDSSGGSTVGSGEVDRLLREARDAGVSIDEIDENGALAAQIERATGVDARRLAARRGGRDRADVSLDVEEGVFRTTYEEERPPQRRRRRQQPSNAGQPGGLEGGDARLLIESRNRRRERVRQLANTTTPRGLLEQTEFNRVTSGGTEGGDVALFRSARPDPEEQFGDIPVDSPFSDNRLEEDIETAADWFRAQVRDEVESQIESGPSINQNPAVNFAARATQAEQAAFAGAAALGIDPSGFPFTEGDNGRVEGPVERASESFFVGAGQAGNVPEFAAEAKEIAEFLATQDDRVSESFTARAEAGFEAASGSSIPFASFVQGASEPEFSDFESDVQDRAVDTVGYGVDRFTSDPVEATAGAAGLFAAGAAVGSGAGSALRRASGGRIGGSDLSGRALTGSARGARRTAAKVRGFYDDTRGQGDLSFGRSTTDTGEVVDEIDAELERMERAQRGEFGLRPNQMRRVREGSRRSSRFLDRMSRESGVPDTPTDDLRRLSDLERDLAESARRAEEDVYTPEGLRVNEVTGGAAAVGLGTGVDTVADELARADAATIGAVGLGEDVGLFGGAGTLADIESDLDVFGDTSTRSRSRIDATTEIDTRTDIFTDFDLRFDGRQDTRLDTPQDSRFDTQFDGRWDTRSDPRLDSQQDTRKDTRLDNRGRRDENYLGESFFGVDATEDLFDSGIQSGDELLKDFGL